MCVCVGVFVLHPLLFPLRWGKTQAISCEYKLAKLILQTGCLLYHLTSWRKQVLIQKLLSQIPKIFNQYKIAERKTNT